MSSKLFLSAPGRARNASAPVRVFEDVAPAPRTPAPAWWNDPLGVLVAVMAAAVLLLMVPDLPPLTSFLLGAHGTVLAVGLTLGRWWWATSRDAAVAEAAWVAEQSGYTLSAAGGALSWTEGGRTGLAELHPGRGWWHLTLHAAPLRVPGGTG